MAIKKTSKKKVFKKKSERKSLLPIDSVIEIVSSQSKICPTCKEAVANYNVSMRSLEAANRKVVSITHRFEKSLENLNLAKSPKQKGLAKKRLSISREAKIAVIADAREKAAVAKNAEYLLRALANLYNISLLKFQKEFARNAAAKAKALKPKASKRRVTKNKTVKK